MSKPRRRKIVFGVARWLARVACWAASKQGVPGAAEAGDWLRRAGKPSQN